MGDLLGEIDGRRALAASLGLLVVAAALCFGGLEVAVRLVGQEDGREGFRFRGRPIRLSSPLPLDGIAERIHELSSPRARVTYDPDLGWGYRRSFASVDGRFRYDDRGVRVGAETPPPSGAALVVALFGDSFTHGDEVPYEETFGFFAERMLEESGVPARVLNLGVGGYGMDQALLRFRRDGAALAPDVVVFGFQAENTHRNRNLVRPLYQPSTGLPFSKPRFVLEDGRLRVINVPPLPPGEIVETLRSFGDWDLAPYDEFYVPGDRAPIWWRRSRLLAVAADLLGPNPWAPDFDPEGASGRLALAIVGAFSEEVRALGARFVILHLPLRETVRSAASGRPPKYAALLAALHARYEVVDPLSRLVEAARDPGVGPLYTLHFTAAGNRVVAGALVPHLEAAAGEASRPEAAGRVRAAGGPLR